MAYSIITPQVLPNTKGMPPRIPRASHRHAAPSGPWPWADLDEEVTLDDPFPGKSLSVQDPDSWRGYPTSLFPNWTPERLVRSGIAKLLQDRDGSQLPRCVIYYVDVDIEGRFAKPSHHEVTPQNTKEFWCKIQVGLLLDCIYVSSFESKIWPIYRLKDQLGRAFVPYLSIICLDR
jgi:hypothetical protein